MRFRGRRLGVGMTGGAAWSREDEDWMALALEEARRAAAAGEVPVGAVLVRGRELLASTHNLRETLRDPTAHAEILAIRRAAGVVGDWRLGGTTMYVTLEPCPMCAGALWLARVERLVYGTADERAGAAGTVYNVVADPRLNHRLRVDAGLLAGEARALLQAFFRRLREQRAPDALPEGPRGEGRAAEGCPSG